jgi:hypothetical protein
VTVDTREHPAVYGNVTGHDSRYGLAFDPEPFPVNSLPEPNGFRFRKPGHLNARRVPRAYRSRGEQKRQTDGDGL